MPIYPNQNRESDKIFQGRFPEENEDLYAEDAASQHKAYQEMQSLVDTLEKASPALHEAFVSGEAADAMKTRYEQHREQLQASADQHRNLAEGLKATATNIAVTKANMNAADAHFHEQMAYLQEHPELNTEGQDWMQQQRAALLTEAQDAVEQHATDYDTVTTQTWDAVANHKPVPTTLSAADGVDVRDPHSAVKDSAGVRTTTSSLATAPASNAGPGLSFSSATLAGMAGASTAGTQAQASPIPASLLASLASQSMRAQATMTAAGTSGATKAASTAAGVQSQHARVRPPASFGRPASPARTVSRPAAHELLEDRTERSAEALVAAAAVFAHLLDTGLGTEVAVATLTIDGTSQMVYATELLVSVATAGMPAVATPVDTWDIDEAVWQRLALLPAHEVLEECARYAGAELSEGVVVTVGALSTDQWEQVSTEQALELAASVQTPAMVLGDLVPADAQVMGEQEMDELAGDHEQVDPLLVKAALARTRLYRGHSPVMPDGTQLSFEGNVLAALALIARDAVAVDATAMEYYGWQMQRIAAMR